MSAATLILAAGTRRREMSAYGAFMWHEASYGVEGRHSAIKATAQQVEKEEKFWAEKMAQFTKKDKKFWAEKGVGIDAYFTPEQLIRYGVADELF